MIDPLSEVEALVAFRGRRAGSDAERRAANHLAARLSDLGRESAVEPIEIHPRWALAHALHGLLAIAGSVVSASTPALGAAMVFVAALSTLLDLTGTIYLGRRVTGTRASQNTVSYEATGKPATLIVTAHCDAARTGAIFAPRLQGRLARIPLAELFVGCMLVVLACAAVRLLGIESTALTAVQFVPTVALIVATMLLVDIALSEPVPGANDNASGVATALRLAEALGDRMQHFDVWLVLTGGQESGGLGMRAWLRRHRSDLERERTVVLNLDEVGRGEPRWTSRDGLLLAGRSHPQLTRLCEDIAEDAGGEAPGPVANRGPSDASVARGRGLAAITITCRDERGLVPGHHTPGDVPEAIEPEALDAAFALCEELARRIDAEIGADLAAQAA